MDDSDRNQFALMLRAVMDVHLQSLSAQATQLWWNLLKAYPLPAVLRAMQSHMADPDLGRYAPKPANLLAHLQRDDGWVGPEEAWAMVAPALGDEAVTIVRTQEMAEALGVAMTLADSPVQARMAFIEAYKPRLSEARSQGRAPVWQVSLGWDADGRTGPVEEAVRLGRISAEHARLLLPPPVEPARSEPVRALA